MPSTETTGWLGDLIRLTAFPVESPGTDVSWWEEVVGGEPDARITRKNGEVEEFGITPAGKLVFRIKPDRMEWVLTADREDGGMPEIGALGKLEDVLPTFVGIAEKWLAVSPPILRFAIGAVLEIPVPDKDAGYELLANYLPFKIDGRTTSDLLYQINRPRPSKQLSGLDINRLNKWSVAVLQLHAVNPAGSLVVEREFFARLELDINTSPEWRQPFDPADLKPLLQELIANAVEIAAKGDEP